MAAANNNNNEQLSGRVDESLQDSSPPAIAPLKEEKENEELRRKRLAQLRLQKAREGLAAGNLTGTAGSNPENDTDAVSELEAASPKTSPVSEHGPVHFVAELAAVTDHADLDYEMPDAPSPEEDDAQEDVNAPEDEDTEMPDAPNPDDDDVDVPNGAEDEDTEMPDAPPLNL